MPLHKMEPAGVISEVNWSSYSASEQAEESEIMAHLLGGFPSQSEQDQEELPFGAPSLFWPEQCPNPPYPYYGSGGSFVYNWSQGDSGSASTCTSTGSLLVSAPEYESYYLNDSSEAAGVCSQPAPMDLSLGQNHNFCLIPNPPLKECFGSNEETSSEERGDSSMNLLESVGLSNRIAQSKRKFFIGTDDKSTAEHDKLDAPVENPEKKAQAAPQARKCSKKTHSKRNQKSTRSGDDEESYSSDNNSTESQEMNDGGCMSPSSKRSPALNLNGKTRSGRGSATDPQSLYARKRRERINERLRILQNLVPNGTKVDISTMLEEAVHYVKFLQLQIKLLSSDELWMYAPIVYNGMNIGVDLKIPLPTQPSS